MLAHAIDHPAPSTIVLISGDRDFAYALSILSLRGYRVILITLSNAHPSLTEQASLSFDWASDILEPSDPTLSHQPTSPRRGKVSSPPAHEKFYPDPKGHNPARISSQESYNEKTTTSTEFFQNETLRMENSRTPKHDARHNFLPPVLEQSKIQPIASSVTSGALQNGPEYPARVIYSPVASSYPIHLSDGIETPLTMTACNSNSSQTTLTTNTSVVSTPKLATYPSIMSSTSSSAHNDLRDCAKPPNLAQHEDANSTKPVSIEAAMRILRAEIDLRESSSSSQQGVLIDAKIQNLISSVDQMASADSPPAHSNKSPHANVTATPIPSFNVIPSSLIHATVSAVAQSSVKVANPRRAAPQTVVLDKFKILIKCLKTHRSRGCLHPFRSMISSEIANNGATYRQAGVLDFGEYVAMAEKADIVELDGSESTGRITLKAPWYNARLS